MPTYEYCCRTCGNEFEAKMAIKDRDSATCQLCGSVNNVVREYRTPPSWKWTDREFLRQREAEVAEEDAKTGGWKDE